MLKSISHLFALLIREINFIFADIQLHYSQFKACIKNRVMRRVHVLPEKCKRNDCQGKFSNGKLPLCSFIPVSLFLMHYAMSCRKLFESFHVFSEKHGVDSRQRSKIIDEDFCIKNFLSKNFELIHVVSILVYPELRVHVL